MNNLLLSLIIPIAAFFFECYPRMINTKMGVDIWTHLLYLQEYHKQGGIPKRIESGFLIPGKYDYPPAFILLLSKFPIKMVEKYEFLFSPFFDGIHIILIFYIALFLSHNLYISLLTQLLYTLTPIIIIENSSATPRSLGYTLFTLVFTFLFMFVTGGNSIFLYVAIFLGIFIFLSHRFTTQGYLFFALFFTVLERNFVFIGAFLTSLILAIVFSKGFYLTVLRGHLGNLIFWYKTIDYRFAHQVKGNYKQYKTKDFVFAVYNQFLKFPPFVLTITNPWTLFVIFIFIFQIDLGNLSNQLIWWVLYSYVLALFITWIPKLRFLGEGQRYLELSAFPAAYLSANLYFHYNNYLFSVLYLVIGIASIITIIVIQRKAIIKDTLRSLTPTMVDMFHYLKALKSKPHLLCIPHQITTNTIYHTGCSVLVNADYTNIQKISDIFPYIKKPIGQIMKKYQLDMVLLNEEYATIHDLKIKNYKEVKRFGKFVLLKFNK